MKKKINRLIPFLLILGFLACSSAAMTHPKEITSCPFCQESILDAQTIYENDHLLLLYTHKPIFPGHCLLIPKRHVERLEELSDEEGTAIIQLIRKVDRAVSQVYGTSAYLILQKNGREVGQSVPHVHMHYIPRKAGECSTVTFLYHMFLSTWHDPISPEEMRMAVEQLSEAMKNS